MLLLSRFSHVCLCDPINCRPTGSSVHGCLQARVLEWTAMPSSKGSPRRRDWTRVSCIVLILLYYWAIRETHTPGGWTKYWRSRATAWPPSPSPSCPQECQALADMQVGGRTAWACHTEKGPPRQGDEGSDNRNSRDTSYLIVPKKPTTSPLASKEPRTHGAGSKLWETPVPGCLALIFLKSSWSDN